MELTRELYRVHPDQYRNNLAQWLRNYAFSFRDSGLSEAARIADAEAVMRDAKSLFGFVLFNFPFMKPYEQCNFVSVLVYPAGIVGSKHSDKLSE